MWKKPFKPPLLQARPRPTSPQLIEDSDEERQVQRPPYKKRRLLVHDVEESPSPQKSIPAKSAAVTAPRKPLLTVTNPVAAAEAVAPISEGPECYYMVLWRKPTGKKHKTWDGDGVLSVRGGYARLQDISGRDMGKCAFKDPLLPGSSLRVGGKEVEVDCSITREDFLAGRPFLNTAPGRTPSSESTGSAPQRKVTLGATPKATAIKKENSSTGVTPRSFYAPAPKSNASQAQFKNPLLHNTVVPQVKTRAEPRYNPNAPGALVMRRPPHSSKGKEPVDVVVDPLLTKHLREHQREGVKFLYECVMGMRGFDGQGALLADEMGLGKTLQTIALVWTLLKQSPASDSDSVIKKALIVCPVTLITNWKKEFNKWLGKERIKVFVADGQNIRLTDFTHGKVYNVMIIGYEKLRSVSEDLKKSGCIDIVIADEGHRLKTAQNKSAQAIKSLNTRRRIILSGTPLQNDLSEFFTMVDFVNPGLLGAYNTFKKEFENPILKSRQPGASAKDVEKGAARGKELSNLTKRFILRRTADILSKYLKSKTEYIVFCKPTQAQAQVYQHVLESPVFNKVLGSPEASLQLITLLKKVCNSPKLLNKARSQDAPSNNNVAKLLGAIPSNLLRMEAINSSSKFRVLDKLLTSLSKTTKEKIVLVSNYTATLDMFSTYLTSVSLPFLRLDGSTPSQKRQGLVDEFNRTSASENFAFLLSAKSGGAGINLIGASRLILFDVDWNPSTDLQAMARIHRDGQKLPVKIYRFLMAGGMDEKIYQRQVTKMGLADSIVDGKKNESSFSPEELRDLFRLDLDAPCQTHDLLGCGCKGRAFAPPQDASAFPLQSSQPEAPASPIMISDEDENEVDHNDASLIADSNPDLDSDDDPPVKPTARPRRATAILDSDDSDDDLPLNPAASFVKSSRSATSKSSSLSTSVSRASSKPKILPASKLNMEAQEAEIVENAQAEREAASKGKMQALMTYSHIDTSVLRGETKDVFGFETEFVEAKKTIDDAVLEEVLEDEKCKVGFVFVRRA